MGNWRFLGNIHVVFAVRMLFENFMDILRLFEIQVLFIKECWNKLVVKKCLMKLFSDVGRLGFRWIDVCKEFL